MNELVRLASVNPACRVAGPAREPLDARARADLAAIVASPVAAAYGPAAAVGRTPAAGPRRTRWVAIAATVLLGVVTALTWTGWGRDAAPAMAVTPPPLAITREPGVSTSQAWDRLIAAAEGSAHGASQRGRASWTEWALWTRVDNHVVTSAIAPIEVSLTPTSGGKTHLLERWATPWTPDGSIGTVDGITPGEVRRDEVILLSMMYPQQPPTTAKAMADYLSQGHPIAEQGTPEAVVAVTDLHREWTLDRDQRLAVLTYLRHRPGLTFAGTTADRLGRPGLAFTVDSDHGGLPVRRTLVFDRGDGRLLDDEQMLTKTAGKLNVTVPAVISYEAFT